MALLQLFNCEGLKNASAGRYLPLIFSRGQQSQQPIYQQQPGIRRNDVDMIRLYSHALFAPLHGHLRVSGENLADKLLRSGAKCWISTNAMSVLAGKLFSNWMNASKPPAEAAIPTTGNGASILASGSQVDRVGVRSVSMYFFQINS